mmetsp:Transcript_11558/g.42279  ORF Transcript_11558/g.42279 Transcript_11558/m.42279 type:complete len:90 (+) Transcript_11558:62-331(+)
MAGNMGNKQVTMQSLLLYRIDPEHNLLFVKGHVPGNTGGFVYVSDAIREERARIFERPFPTYMSDDENMVNTFRETVAKMEVDPFLAYN